MIATRLVLGQLDTNCWIAEDGVGGPLVVIDPAGDAARILGDARPPRGGHRAHPPSLRSPGGGHDVGDESGAPLMVHESEAGEITPDGTGGDALRL